MCLLRGTGSPNSPGWSARPKRRRERTAMPLPMASDEFLVPPDTPADVHITREARKPETDPTLGIRVGPVRRDREPAHRLVTLGDSLTHGFQSLAISKTHLSWPVLIARALGLSDSDFRVPTYDGYGGLPLTLGGVVRGLQRKLRHLGPASRLSAVLWLWLHLRRAKRWWIGRADESWNPPPGLNHNLAVYSYDLQAACSRKLSDIETAIKQRPTGIFRRILKKFEPFIPDDVDRAARRVLVHAGPDMALVDAVRRHG